jgi:hypothetical protein
MVVFRTEGMAMLRAREQCLKSDAGPVTYDVFVCAKNYMPKTFD